MLIFGCNVGTKRGDLKRFKLLVIRVINKTEPADWLMVVAGLRVEQTEWIRWLNGEGDGALVLIKYSSTVTVTVTVALGAVSWNGIPFWYRVGHLMCPLLTRAVFSGLLF